LFYSNVYHLLDELKTVFLMEPFAEGFTEEWAEGLEKYENPGSRRDEVTCLVS
jgi:hypothetical protein